MTMKKNKIMRLASILFVAVILSTCAISGTFAKYTTSSTASDTARVAKWGVTLTVPTESSFNTEYKNSSDVLTVESSDTDKVAAPGTEGTALTFTIAGTPEVATKVIISMTINNEIHVDEYYPIVWTLTQDGVADPVATGKLSDIQTALTNYSGTEYAPNTDLGATFTLNWAWAFEQQNDANDTLLGNVANDVNYPVGAGVDVDTEINYTVTFTVEQVD